MADQPRVKKPPEWFLAVRFVSSVMQSQFRTPLLADDDQPGMFKVLPDGPTFAIVVHPRPPKIYRIPEGLVSSLYVCCSIEDIPDSEPRETRPGESVTIEDIYASKIVRVDGVISRKRLMAANKVRADKYFHVRAARLDSLLDFGIWTREQGDDSTVD